MRINGALYYQIIDPKRAVYEVENMSQAVEVLAKTTLRSVVGKMELDKLFESRAEVNNEIQAAMEEPASKWGVKISGRGAGYRHARRGRVCDAPADGR